MKRFHQPRAYEADAECNRFGYGKQLDFNREISILCAKAAFFGAYVEHRRSSLFQGFLDDILPVLVLSLGLGHFNVASFSLYSQTIQIRLKRDQGR